MSTQNRSDDPELVRKNLELIISSNNYQLAHEDRELLNSDEMRGVRMLLEINKPEKILEEQKILSTIIVFGGASLSDKSSIDHRIELAKNSLTKDPSSSNLKRELTRLKNLQSISHYYDSARESSRRLSPEKTKKSIAIHM